MSPREASLTDPQHGFSLNLHGKLLKMVDTTLIRYKGSIGVFAGCNPNGYLLYHAAF